MANRLFYILVFHERRIHSIYIHFGIITENVSIQIFIRQK